ncbi:histone-like nucleoid-structuring protein Lsr2 [Streptomyces sp. NPDC001422]|uniref:Lsr2 family DNA-binding protein n=1 Tax=Streptomyces sp. NPDC001422 TaxID=3364575 RepID=UPI00367BB5A2
MKEIGCDAGQVREFMVLKGLRRADDHSDVTPPEVRFFNQWYPLHEKQQAAERSRREENERRSVERRAANERYMRRKERMRHMRQWGNENGLFVGTRGRISRKVIEAYEEAFGSE